jgi:uncharacterized protein YfaP (DUF2135 family)
MKWDTDKTDIDMHVVEPAQTVNYQTKTSWQGGVLDRDVTSGFGPETYALRRRRYRKVHAEGQTLLWYLPTTVSVDVIYNKGGANEERSIHTVKLDEVNQLSEVLTFTLPLATKNK